MAKLFSSLAALLLLLATIFIVSCACQAKADVATTSVTIGDNESSDSPVLYADNGEDDDEEEESYDVTPIVGDEALPSRKPTRPSPSRKPTRPSPSRKPTKPSPSRKPTWPSPSRKPHTPSRQPSPSHTPSPSPTRMAFKKLI